MIVSLIVAASENNAIGKANTLPWKLPADMHYFKHTTIGKPVVMGRKTFESLGRPLPGRLNIVLSGSDDVKLPGGVLLYHDLKTVVDKLEGEDYKEIFIIGGGKVFAESILLADTIYLTRVHTHIVDADAFFPNLDHTHWKMVWEESHLADEKNQYAYTFQKYERVEL